MPRPSALIVPILATAITFFGLSIGACNAQKAATDTTLNQSSKRRQGPPSIDKVFEMDTNKDGKLSKAEVKGPLLEDFARIDANSDGFLTRAEVDKASPKGRPQGGQRPN